MTLRVWGLVFLLAAALLLPKAAWGFELPPPAAEKYKRDLIRTAHSEWGLNAPIPVLAGQLEQESMWNPNARSPVGASGLAQFMPATARDMAMKFGPAAPEPLNPVWALRAQARYMKDLFAAMPYKDECSNIGAALSSYNGGMGWHNKRRLKAKDPNDFWLDVRYINPGITASNQQENQEYSWKIVFERQLKYLLWGRAVCAG